MLKGGEKCLFCVWLRVGTILNVEPISDFACEGFVNLQSIKVRHCLFDQPAFYV